MMGTYFVHVVEAFPSSLGLLHRPGHSSVATPGGSRGCSNTGHALSVPTDAGSTAAGPNNSILAPMLTLLNVALSCGHTCIVH